MSRKIRTEAVDSLFDAVLSLKAEKNATHSLKMSARSMSFYRFHSVLK